MKKNIVSSALLAGVLAAAGCGYEAHEARFTDPQGVPVAEEGIGAAPSERIDPADAPFDVPALIERARMSFHELDGRIATARDTFRAELRGDTLRFTPRAEGVEGPAAEIRTESIARGEAYPLEAAVPSVEADGSVVIDRGVAVERFLNQRAALEQTWTFEQPPLGEGSLEVAVAVHGLRYAGQSPGGHHFLDPESDRGVRYGRAYWVDASEARTEVPVEYRDGRLLITVDETVLASTVYPAVLDPMILAESGLIAVATGINYAVENQPRVDYHSGTNRYLVVWSDLRNGQNFDIYGARVAANGTILDIPARLIAGGAGDQVEPAVSLRSGEFLVVYASNETGNYDIRGVTVQPDGTVGTSFSICNAAGDQRRPTVDNTIATNWMVAWEDARGATQNIYYGRVGPGPAILDGATGLRVSNGDASVWQSQPAVGCGGTFCLVTWVHDIFPANEEIRGLRIRLNGAVQEASFLIGSSTARDLSPHVDGTGTEFLVVYQSNGAGTGADIRGKRVRHDVSQGQLIGFSATVAISIAALPGSQTVPRVSYHSTAGNYAVTWVDSASGNRDVYARRVSTTGTLLEANPRLINVSSFDQSFPAIAQGRDGTSNEWLIVWADSRFPNAPHTRGTTIQANLTPEFPSPLIIARAARRQTEIAITFGGTQPSTRVYYLAWAEAGVFNADSYDIFAMRVDQNGNSQDPTGRAITFSTNIDVGPDLNYDAASNQILIVWESVSNGNSDIRASRTSPTLAVQGAGGFLVASGAAEQSFPRVSFSSGANQWLVVYQDRTSGIFEIFGQRVDTAGALVGTPIQISPASAGHKRRPDVAGNANGWFVAYQDAVGGGSDVGGRFLTTATTLGAELGLGVAAGVQEYARLNFDGTDFLAVWEDNRNGNGDVYGQRVDATGTALVGANVAYAATGVFEGRPDFAVTNDATNGVAHYLVWREADAMAATTINIRGRHFTTAGAPLAAIDDLSMVGGNADQPTAQAGATGNGIAAYQRFDASPTLAAQRGFRRILRFP